MKTSCAKQLVAEFQRVYSRRLLAGLALFELYVATVSSLELTKWGQGWAPIVLLWVGLGAVCGLLFQLSIRRQNISLFSLLVALVSFSLPFWAAASAENGVRMMILWGVGIPLLGAAVPWRIRELSFLGIFSLVAGASSLSRMFSPIAAVLIALVVTALILSLSVLVGRRIRERVVLLQLPRLVRLAECMDELLALAAVAVEIVTEAKGVLLLRGTEAGVYLIAGQPLPIKLIPTRLQELSAGRELIEHLSYWAGDCSVELEGDIQLALLRGVAFRLFSGRDTISLIAVEELSSAGLLLRSSLPSLLAINSIIEQSLKRFVSESGVKEQIELSEQQNVEREYELGTLVHDINNTVQDLTLLCDSLLDDGVRSDEGSLTAIRRISLMARSMATFVSDAKRRRELERLNDLSPRELVELGELCEEIVAFAAVRAERKRISVSFERTISHEAWARVSAREHCETVLRNLLNNAILYSDPGSHILVRLGVFGGDVQISVQDNGPGLSGEECLAIFQAGYRGKQSRRQTGGLGLGLHQSVRVLESAGGSLEVYSKGAGHGSTFTMHLPLEQAPAQSISGQRDWVLMVDDQQNLTDFYAKIARALHLTPAVANSVAEAIACVADRGCPKFVLTDLHLGSSDGLDLVRFLRREFGSGVPILVVSGMNDDDVEQRVKSAGATDFVAKPISKRALFSRIQSLLPG